MSKIRTVTNTLKLLYLLGVATFNSKKSECRPLGKHRRIAFFSAFLPPFESGGVHRLVPLIKAIEESDNQCIYYTRKHPRSDRLTESEKFMQSTLPANAEIIRTGTSHFKTINAVIPKVDGGIQSAVAAYYEALSHQPETDVVFASGPSFNYVVAAYLYAVKVNAPLIIDYRDEWTDCPFAFVTKSPFSRRLEKAIVNYATKIIMTTEGMIAKHISSFNQPKEKYSLVRNGWDESLDESNSSEITKHPTISLLKELGKSKNVLLYVGGLGVATPPFEFLDYLIENAKVETLQQTAIVFVGHVEKSYLPLLENYSTKIEIIVQPQVQKNVAIESLKYADFLLLFTNKNMERYLPGKLFDYLKSGTRIINFGCKGAAANILKELDAGINIDPLYPQCYEDILLTKGQNYNNSAQDWLEQHKRVVLSKKILNLIENLMN
ncbi:hypothetical protein [Alteromonas oceanisediminis]|uniref:hypothetical protein n=1 Tax=Alteromonas oceanisediminis TaxID=2836180 RepID=UPI001BD9E7E1|nr:hypothetical protein [Alteromonas oceanisediminis]MBT0585682.1 hypothetical protein [Alteromonas oceanisediminis]